MTWIRPDLYKAIVENDVSSVVFSDPFTDDTRKAKRNLLIAAFVALLIAISGLQVEARALYKAWAKTVNGMSHLDFRLKVRILSLWLLEIVFPVALGAVANSWKGYAVSGEFQTQD